MGSWSFDDGKLEFQIFVPNTLYHENILENLALSMSIRSDWVNQQFGKWFNQAG